MPALVRFPRPSQPKSMDAPTEHQLDVSVVLPIYNEADHLIKEVERIRDALDASSLTYEIIAVDDGSTDGSAEILESIDGIRKILFPTNRGSGFVRRVGTQLARGRYVVWTDVDMTYPNDRIPDLIGELADVDHVVGARTSEEGTLKFLRIPAKWLIRRLAQFLTKSSIPDLNSGLRAFRRDVALQYLHLLPDGFSCVTTLTMAFLSNGYHIRYTPIEYRARSGTSKFHWWSDTRRYLLQVIRMTMLYNPLRVLMPIGLVVLASGVGKTVYDVFTKDFRIATNTLALLLAGVGIVVVALLADQAVQLGRDKEAVVPQYRSPS